MLEQMPSKATSLVRGLAAVEVREVCGHTQRTCGSVRPRDSVNNANMRPVAAACKRQSYSVLLALVLLFCHSAALAQDSQADPKLLQKQYTYRGPVPCDVNCTVTEARVVCGTDGRTYSSACHLQRARLCDGRPVAHLHDGKCGGSVSSSDCLEQQALAQRTNGSSHVPRCLPDGKYAPVQCHGQSDYCWCVDELGKLIRGISYHKTRISCHQRRAAAASHSHNTTSSTSPAGGSPAAPPVTMAPAKRPDKPRRDVKKPACSSTEQATFNSNLIRHFTDEFDRAPNQHNSDLRPDNLPLHLDGVQPAVSQGSKERRVVEWKFSRLDSNGNSRLQRSELRDLRQMIKKTMKPKSCARAFYRYCDKEHDNQITRSEWLACLGIGTRISLDLFLSLNPEDRDSKKVTDAAARGRPRDRYDGPNALLTHNLGFNDSSPAIGRDVIKGNNLKSEESRENQSEQPQKKDCLSERQKALELDKMEPKGNIFIPECTDTGAYRKEQCHRMTGYCWCVNDSTGLPIPETSTRNVMPNCSLAKSVREMKGCSYPAKRKFLVDLLDDISTQMVEHSNNKTSRGANTVMSAQQQEEDARRSLEERAVRWKFASLDRDNDGTLSRSEWRSYRQVISSTVGHKKCGRNFLRYCDENEDGNITLHEWIDCTGVAEIAKKVTVNKKRLGPNPFQKYLRS